MKKLLKNIKLIHATLSVLIFLILIAMTVVFSILAGNASRDSYNLIVIDVSLFLIELIFIINLLLSFIALTFYKKIIDRLLIATCFLALFGIVLAIGIWVSTGLNIDNVFYISGASDSFSERTLVILSCLSIPLVICLVLIISLNVYLIYNADFLSKRLNLDLAKIKASKNLRARQLNSSLTVRSNKNDLKYFFDLDDF